MNKMYVFTRRVWLIGWGAVARGSVLWLPFKIKILHHISLLARRGSSF